MVLEKGKKTFVLKRFFVWLFWAFCFVSLCAQSEPLTKFYEGHLLESETYIGGHVECLEVSDASTLCPVKRANEEA